MEFTAIVMSKEEKRCIVYSLPIQQRLFILLTRATIIILQNIGFQNYKNHFL